jgi:hypothetical protein
VATLRRHDPPLTGEDAVRAGDVAATRKLQVQRMLLRIAAVVEILAGLVLILLPGPTIRLLLGAPPDVVGLMVGRIAGVALLALGVACWGARSDAGGAARVGTVGAITLYNLGVGGLLVLFALTGEASGLGVWSAGLFHLVLAAGFLFSQ